MVLSFSLAHREAVRSLNMGYALSGKTALVTGANRGIGEAIVDALVAAGVKKVYAAARNISTLDPLVDRHGSRVVPLQLDVTNAAQIATAAATRPTSISWSTTRASSASSVAILPIRSGLRAGDRRWK